MSEYLPATAARAPSPIRCGLNCGKLAHESSASSPQFAQLRPMLILLIELAIQSLARASISSLSGICARVRRAGLARRLSFRIAVVIDAVLGHEARGEVGDALAQDCCLIAAHAP